MGHFCPPGSGFTTMEMTITWYFGTGAVPTILNFARVSNFLVPFGTVTYRAHVSFTVAGGGLFHLILQRRPT
jgi:hypothetical protein